MIAQQNELQLTVQRNIVFELCFETYIFKYSLEANFELFELYFETHLFKYSIEIE